MGSCSDAYIPSKVALSTPPSTSVKILSNIVSNCYFHFIQIPNLDGTNLQDCTRETNNFPTHLLEIYSQNNLIDKILLELAFRIEISA